jgi:spore germination cell wall hydrolase CwlJ-like protein
LIDLPPQEIRCIEIAVQHETTGKLYQGAVEVAEVVINRSKSSDYPSTPCAVIYQKKQFTNIYKTKKASKEAKEAVKIALTRYEDGTANKTTVAFHSLKRTPRSWRNLVFKFRIGRHRFYAKEQ